MPTVVPVKFSYAARELWFDWSGSGAQEGDHVICQTERGQEIGLAIADARKVTADELTDRIGEAELKCVLRVATPEDLDRAERLAQLSDDALPVFRRFAAEENLEMKPVGVEYLFDGEKVVCYFSADERVDFRQLVRDLSHELHQRIDMRQIGVREVAAVIGGYGHCGQELCCRRFGLSFEPVSIRMAKEQDLPLNSTKISGACGRLMCCLRYEFEAYKDFKGRAPKRNAVIETPLGTGKIVEYNTPKEEVSIRLENGKIVRIPLCDMTASDAARKKSEEFNCACRPDSVTREVLERLDSPDVQMALAELDRENGLIENDEPEINPDLFVKTPRTRRIRASRVSERAQDDAAETPSATTTSRRRRRHQAEDNETLQDDFSRTVHTADTQKPKADRREKQRPAGKRFKKEAVVEEVPQEEGTRRVKRTRRPGDRGGMRQQSVQSESQEKRVRRPRRQHVAQESSPSEEQQNGTSRRRHHRGDRSLRKAEGENDSNV